jgi:histone H3/H4
MLEAVSVTSADAKNRSLRTSQRTSKTNLIRSSLSPPRPTTDIKDYELKVNKDIIKKLDHCQINHLAIEHKPRNNLSLRFSTSAYELLNTLLYELLEQILETKNLAIVVEKGTDKKNEDVESRYRLVSKLKNDKAGNQVKFTIN